MSHQQLSMAENTRTYYNHDNYDHHNNNIINGNGNGKALTIQQFISPITETLSDSSLLYRLSYQFSKTYKQIVAHSTEQFFPTPITQLPTGKERGRYLAVYVGLFYLHVGFIELLGSNDDDDHSHDRDRELNGWFTVRRTLEKAWPIEERLKLENPVEFFAWIGACIAEVVGDRLRNESLDDNQYNRAQHPDNRETNGGDGGGYEVNDENRELIAGISFCFPIVQKSLDEAILLPTGKGFALKSDLNLRQALLDGYECHIRPQSPPTETNPWDDDETEKDGHDKKREEEEEEEERRTTKRRKHFSLPKLKIAAMTNDTVATFASLAYSIKSLRVPNSRVVMGLMVGAGCNATVSMKVSDLHPSKTQFFTSTARSAEETETLVCTEWTLRRSSQPILDMNLLTKWDKQIEASSQPPGFQPMEYMVGGRYMGELVRLIVLDYFTNVLKIPIDVLPWRLLESGGLTTDFLSLNVAASSSSSSSGYPIDKSDEDEILAKELNQRLSSTKGWTWNAEKAGILRTVAFAVQSRSAAVIAAATVGLLACTGEIQLRNPDYDDKAAASNNNNHIINYKNKNNKNDHDNNNNGNNKLNINVLLQPPIQTHSQQEPTPTPGISQQQAPAQKETWNHSPEELVVAFCGGVIQNYPRYKENLQRHIDRLLVHGGPQKDGKSILLREVNDGGIIGVGVLAGSVMGRIEGIVGSRLNV